MQNFLIACTHLDPLAIIQTGSYVGIATLVFAESGILLGIFLPGDSLLFAAGLLAGTSVLSFPLLTAIIVASAIAGDSVGYWFGTKAGGALSKRPDSRFFKHAWITRTEAFYARYGGRAVVLARFVPIVRTIAPILAGAGSMSYRRFLAYNIVGGVLWGAGMTGLGYTIGASIPESQHYVLPISLVIVAISFLPVFWNLIKSRQS